MRPVRRVVDKSCTTDHLGNHIDLASDRLMRMAEIEGAIQRPSRLVSLCILGFASPESHVFEKGRRRIYYLFVNLL
ncbi:hypothetical protein ROLI_015450 [Roseobacter fucihabitans]|uniref:Uncharacterized protein n=1 Tax=Roseobacter fucihabitans TaxID=1537242 RepID=A0ABZ2BSP7_9RHOB|nr:hypothetical protein [Roseobacter litoralis]